MKWNLANILTVGRLALVPVFLASFIFQWYLIAFLCFVIASFTDIIDGAVARYFKQHSQLGAFLDPLADKLLMISTFSCLVYVRIVPGWFLVLVILRDIMIMGGIGLLKYLKIEVVYEPFMLSKFTTLFQILLGSLALLFLWRPFTSFGSYPLVDFVEGCMIITTVLILITGLQYAKKGLEILQDATRKRHRA